MVLRRSYVISFLFLLITLQDLNMCTPLGQEPLCWQLVFLFPGVHVVLLDSDCVPITLFEVADLWKEVSLLQNGLTRSATTVQ